MDPSICEFVAENEFIDIVPNFNDRLIHLVSGDFGPFEAGLPVSVPLWLAMHLKGKYKCTIVPPEWLNLEELKKFLLAESEKTTFAPLPDSFFEIAHILITRAAEDMDNADQLKSFVKDIQDKREAKMRTSIIKFMEQFQNVKSDILQSDKAIIHPNATLNNLTRLEICYFRAALSEHSKHLDRLFGVLHSLRLD